MESNPKELFTETSSHQSKNCYPNLHLLVKFGKICWDCRPADCKNKSFLESYDSEEQPDGMIQQLLKNI